MTSLMSNIPPELYDILMEQKPEELPKHCLICGNHPFFVGLFDKPEINRMLIYCLCIDCYENPDYEGTVEKIICHYETTKRCNPNLLDYCGRC